MNAELEGADRPTNSSVVGALTWNPAWVAQPLGPTSVGLSAGADRQVVLDGLGCSDVDGVLEASDGDESRTLSASLTARLVDLGVLGLDVSTAGDLVGVTVEFISKHPSADALVDALAQRRSTVAVGRSGLLVTVRCGPESAPCSSTDQQASRPRLVVDVGAEHTVVFGPLVVPGASACEECLDRRIARRWPTPPQPDRPGVAQHVDLIAALLDRHIELAMRASSPLVNHTIAADLDTMTARRDSLLMSPGCSTCSIASPDPRPRLAWTVA